jgi:hypothetical protein
LSELASFGTGCGDDNSGMVWETAEVVIVLPTRERVASEVGTEG